MDGSVRNVNKKRGSKTTIRIVEATQKTADMMLLGAEELRTTLEALAEKIDPLLKQSVIDIKYLINDLQELRDRAPGNDFLGLYQIPDGATTDMTEVLLRRLLYFDSVVPVVIWPPADDPDPDGAVRVRPATRKPAYTTKGRRVALAAEEAIMVVGLVVDRRMVGELLLAIFAGGHSRSFRRYALSGTYDGEVISVANGRRDPAANPFPTNRILTRALETEEAVARGYRKAALKYHPYTPRLVKTLNYMLRNALNYHLEAGAAAGLEAAYRYAKDNLVGGGPLTQLMACPPSCGLEPGDGSAQHIVANRARFFIGELSKVFAEVSDSPDEFVFYISSLLDIYRIGGGEVFYDIIVQGRETCSLRRFLERGEDRQNEEHQIRQIAKTVFVEIARARQLMIIVEDKLGPARAAALTRALEADGLDDPEKILAGLTKRGRELVTNEYQNRLLEWKSHVGNKCPHIKLATRMRHAKSAREAFRLLEDLSKYAKPTSWAQSKTWIMCQNCSHRLLCPHVRDLITMEAKAYSYDEVRTGLMKYAVKYSDRSADGVDSFTTYFYFCRICSERLAEFVREDRTAEVMGAVGKLDDYIRKLIWVEAVHGAELVRFPIPVDPRHFANTAADICHPLLLQAEESLLKRGRQPGRLNPGIQVGPDNPFGDVESVEPRVRLYIVLFVYAYILNLIRSSNAPGGAAGRGKLGFDGVRPGSKISKYAQAILTTVLKKYSGLIAQIEDITSEFIANRFREAYRMVIGVHGPQELTVADEAKILIRDIVETDPVYHYAGVTARIFGALPLGRPDTPKTAAREFESIVGVPLPLLLKNYKPEKQSKLIQMLLGIRPGSGARRMIVDYPIDSDPDYIYGIPEVNFYSNMYEISKAVMKTIVAAPFHELSAVAKHFPTCLRVCVGETVVGGRAPAKRKAPKKGAAKRKAPKKGAAKYDRSVIPELAPAMASYLSESYQLFTEYATQVVSGETWERFIKHLQAARQREMGLMLTKMAASTKNFRRFEFVKSRRFGFRDNKTPQPITYIYDENGLPHTWAGVPHAGHNIYVYRNDRDAEDTRELTTADIVRKTREALAKKGEPSPLHGYHLSDVRCSVCRTLLSEVSRLNVAQTWESLNALSEFTAFYAFYKSRCPADGLHEFRPSKSGESRCAKCGMLEVLIFSNKNSKFADEARQYYDKYSRRYNEQRVLAHPASGVLDERPEPAAKEDDPFRAFAKKWKYNYRLVVEAAKLTEVPVAALETLGATERRLYSAVLEGVDAPPPPTSPDDPRLLAVDSNVRLFTTDYNRLRFISRFSAPPARDLELLKSAGVPPDKYESLAQALPKVFDNYYKKQKAMLRYRAPEDVLLFMIEALSQMAIKVAEAHAPPPWRKNLGRLFARRTIQAIVRSERLLAKNGPFNFKIFGDDDDFGSGTGTETVEVGTATEDVLSNLAADDNAIDTFAHGAVDVEDGVLASNL